MVADGTSEVGIIAYGTSHWASGESRDQLRKEYKIETDYLRGKSLPVHGPRFTSSSNKHKRIYVIDQNRDGQMLQLLKLDLPAEQIGKLRSVRHYDGLPIDARSITDDIRARGRRRNHGNDTNINSSSEDVTISG